MSRRKIYSYGDIDIPVHVLGDVGGRPAYLMYSGEISDVNSKKRNSNAAPYANRVAEIASPLLIGAGGAFAGNKLGKLLAKRKGLDIGGKRAKSYGRTGAYAGGIGLGLIATIIGARISEARKKVRTLDEQAEKESVRRALAKLVVPGLAGYDENEREKSMDALAQYKAMAFRDMRKDTAVRRDTKSAEYEKGENMNSYQIGFMNKCAEYGVDPIALAKYAGMPSDAQVMRDLAISDFRNKAPANALIGAGIGGLTGYFNDRTSDDEERRKNAAKGLIRGVLLGGAAGALGAGAFAAGKGLLRANRFKKQAPTLGDIKDLGVYAVNHALRESAPRQY